MSVPTFSHGRVGRSGCIMGSLGCAGLCLLHKSQFFTICLISVEIPGQNTDSLARRIHLFSPWCPRCTAWRTWFLMEAGMKILLPFSTRPSSKVRSHRKFQNSHSSCGHCFLWGGQPLKMVLFSRLSVRSCSVEDFTAIRSIGVDIKWMLRCDAESSVTRSCPAFL